MATAVSSRQCATARRNPTARVPASASRTIAATASKRGGPSKPRTAPVSERSLVRWQARLEQLQSVPIAYLEHPCFARRNVDQLLADQRPATLQTLDAPLATRADQNLLLVASFAQRRLLSHAEEEFLFCWMNYLKFQASRTRKRLKAQQPDYATAARIEGWLDEAATVRNQIVTSNLRLVVALARKLANSPDQLAELVSEGVVPLMRAVELFDVSLGNRFSTYATWAVRNQMHRWLKKCQNAAQQEWHFGALESGEDQLPDTRPPIAQDLDESAQVADLSRWLEHLSERERLVISARFGLLGHPKGQSLAEISEQVGLSKERVRQIALQSLEKLRAVAEGLGHRFE